MTNESSSFERETKRSTAFSNLYWTIVLIAALGLIVSEIASVRKNAALQAIAHEQPIITSSGG